MKTINYFILVVDDVACSLPVTTSIDEKKPASSKLKECHLGQCKTLNIRVQLPRTITSHVQNETVPQGKLSWTDLTWKENNSCYFLLATEEVSLNLKTCLSKHTWACEHQKYSRSRNSRTKHSKTAFRLQSMWISPKCTLAQKPRLWWTLDI